MSNGIWICLQGQLFQNGELLANHFDIIGDGFAQQPEGTYFCEQVEAHGETTIGFISAVDI